MLIFPCVSQSVPAISLIGIVGRVHDRERVTGLNQGVVLIDGLPDHIIVGLTHAGRVGVIRHLVELFGDAPCAFLVHLYIYRLSTVLDVVGACVFCEYGL